MAAWQHQLMAAEQVFVFCSESKSAVDPARDGTGRQPVDCQSYRFIEESQWQPRPSGIRVPHPFRPGQTLASAFVVKQITYPVEQFQRPTVEWFSLTQGPCAKRISQPEASI